MQDNNHVAPQTPPDNHPEIRIGKELVEILGNLVNSGDWHSSLFLKTLKKRIQDIIDETQGILQDKEDSAVFATEDRFRRIVPPGYVRAYILLYQTEGGKLSNWQYALKTLLEYNVSRPTYLDENYVLELVRSKRDMDRYGYAVINIAEQDIYTQIQQPKDILGHEMIILKENAIKRENIIGFVHANKKRYSFIDSELVYHGDIG